MSKRKVLEIGLILIGLVVLNILATYLLFGHVLVDPAAPKPAGDWVPLARATLGSSVL